MFVSDTMKHFRMKSVLFSQIAKLEGCAKVVGICGTQEKCDWLTNDLKFDGAVNYKSDGLEQRLKDACPHGIDIYFDNVGGAVTNCVIRQVGCNIISDSASLDHFQTLWVLVMVLPNA